MLSCKCVIPKPNVATLQFVLVAVLQTLLKNFDFPLSMVLHIKAFMLYIICSICMFMFNLGACGSYRGMHILHLPLFRIGTVILDLSRVQSLETNLFLRLQLEKNFIF
jgi:hypothetical protein